MCRARCLREMARRTSSRSALPVSEAAAKDPTSVSLFDQGLIQILQASITGLEPKKPYVLALASHRDGQGILEPLSAFMTNPSGSAIVNTAGPIRQIVRNDAETERRYLVIAEGTVSQLGAVIQTQALD